MSGTSFDVRPSANMAGISITATSTDPQSAAALANQVGTAYGQVARQRATADAARAIASLEKLRNRYQADLDASPKLADGRLTSRQQQLTGQITDIQQREQDITTQAEVYASGVEYFERAEPPTTPSQPKPKLAAALGALLGLLAAAAWAWRAAARDQPPRAGTTRPGSSKRRCSARCHSNTALQASSTRALRPAGGDGQSGHAAADRPGPRGRLHLIVASMEHELAGAGGKSIAVTSVGPGDSKTSTALQIANAASRTTGTSC